MLVFAGHWHYRYLNSIYTVEEILNSNPLNTSIILISIRYTDIFQKQLIALHLN